MIKTATADLSKPKRATRIRIQPAMLKDKTLPYPYFIEIKTGLIGRQDFWKGKPYRLQGFQPRFVTGVVKGTIGYEEWLENPRQAIGMYPIFEDSKGDFTTFGIKIAEVDVL